MKSVLQLVGGDGTAVSATVRVSAASHPVSLAIEAAGLPASMTFDGEDLEDCLVALRADLDRRGQRLLCNRFRRDALVTGMSRGMSGGRSCYLVTMGRPVLPERDLVDSLSPARAEQVVSADEAAAHIEAYVRSCRSRAAMAQARIRSFVTRRR